MASAQSDESLKEAFDLEQRLSAQGITSAIGQLYGTSFPCTVHKTILSKDNGVEYFWKMPRRWYADPLNPWNIMLLILWIPINVFYFSYQLVRYLITMRYTWSLPVEDVAQLTPEQLSFSPHRFGLSGPIPYRNISAIGHYTNGVRIDCGGERLLLTTSATPTLFVALTHLAPAASVTSGLNVPPDFTEWVAQKGRLDISRMSKNSPESWNRAAQEYKLPIPKQVIAGYVLLTFFILLFLTILRSN